MSVVLLRGTVYGVMPVARPSHGRYHMPGVVPRRGAVPRKYAGMPCQICGAVIPSRVPQGGMNGLLVRGPYCSQACWQRGPTRLQAARRQEAP